ncbi:MAG: cytochrome c oxidase assembly protein [Nakamurella sp.]
MEIPPFTGSRLWTDWGWTPISDALVCVALVGYLVGVVLVRRGGARWSVLRTGCFLAGLAVLVVSLDSAIDPYSRVLFWMHMVRHLLLITVVPALLVLGHPLDLLNSTGPRGRRLVAALRANPLVALLTHPLIAFVIYGVVLVCTHLTGFMNAMPTHHWLHPFEQALYVVSGYLFLQPLLAREPIRWNPPYPARFGLLLISMVIDAFVGLTLMLTPHDPFPALAAMRSGWGPSPVDDLHIGGALMWAGGDGLMAIAAFLLIAEWVNDKDRQDDMGVFLEGARRGALAGIGGDLDTQSTIHDSVDVDDDDEVLLAYNRMLAALDERSGSARTTSRPSSAADHSSGPSRPA